jgi:transcriptional regulator with AAA-type ATPase domain/tetratricopeptide (TPR) repeat protein
MLPLVADRFLCDRGRWFDLATGRLVALRINSAGPKREQFDWSDRCAVLSRLRHPLLNPLVDFGYAAAHATFEAYAVQPPLRTSPVAGSHAATHMVRFLRAHGISLNRELAAALVRPVQPARRKGRTLGVLLQPRKILDTLAEALEGGGTGPVRLEVTGPVRSGMTTLRQLFARVARLAGYLPVSVEALRRWPELQRLTSGRHVCIISGEPIQGDVETYAAWLARLGVESTRRHLHVSLLRTPEPSPGALYLDPLGVTAMTCMIYIDPEFGPSAKEVIAAARVADGWPGRLLAGLHAEAFDTDGGSTSLMVHETAAPYAVSDESVARGARVSTPRRIESALIRAERRAVTLANRGRHAQAVRLLDRAVRLFEGRGQRDELVRSSITLAWVLRSRGAGEPAKARIDHARRLVTDSAAHVVLSTITGILYTDDGRFIEAEAALRGATTAGMAIDRDDLCRRSSLGLARALFWQGKTGEALAALEALSDPRLPDVSSEALSLVARIHRSLRDVAPAVAAASQALQRSHLVHIPRITASAHRAMALALSLAGDPPAALEHIRSGMRAAVSGHLPLTALRLRADWLGILMEHGDDTDITGRLRRRLDRASRRQRLPHVLRQQIEVACRPPMSSPSGRCRAAGHDARNALAELVDVGQCAPDDREALVRILDATAGRLHASSSLILANGERIVATNGRPWRERPICARRALETGLDVGVDPVVQPPEAAAAIKYAGTTIAAVACRWPPATITDRAAATFYLDIASIALSPHVHALLDVPEAPPRAAWADLLGESPAAGTLREAVQRAARAPFSVLIEGESGSGKELVARAIHRHGQRRDRRFCAVNCAAITDELIEAELFGHARGAFTGASSERAGLFEEADGGSLFLDEVGELSARAQAKLLRVLQDGEVRRVGENFPRRVDVRVIAATNRRLEQEVTAGRFRADLRFRLDVVRISVPPLRDRITDIPILAAHFWTDAAARVGSRATLGPEMLTALSRYDWPGNVRELQNAMASLAVQAPRRGKIGAAMLPQRLAASEPLSTGSFEAAREDFERRFVRAALVQTGGHRARTAEVLGVSRQGLAKMMKRLGIE